MKILNISALYPPNVIGGAELAVHNIAAEWVRLGHTVDALTLATPESSVSQYVIDGVTVTRLPLANLYWPYGDHARPSTFKRLGWHAKDTNNKTMSRLVLKHLERIEPEVVVTNNLQGFSTRVIKEIAAAGVPVVHVAHDCSLICVRASLFKNGARCQRRCLDCRTLTLPRKAHTEWATGFIAVSNSVLQQHQSNGVFLDTPSTVIGNALRSDLVPTNPSSKRQQRSTTFGYIGRLEQAKGIETLLRAVSHLNDQGETFNVRLAGTGDPAYVAYLQKSWPLTNVDYMGFCDPAHLYSATDILVFPSESYESFGTVIVEAYSQGIPVIASDCGGPAELVTPETGKLVTPGCHEALGRAMADCIRSRKGELTDKQPSWAESSEFVRRESDKYSVTTKAGEYLKAIRTFNGFGF